MALGTYTGLSTSIGTWTERGYDQSQIDEFIMLAEAAANRRLRQDFRRRSSATVATDADGYATLPTGFVGMSSLVRDVLGSEPLRQVSWDALVWRNPYESADDASVYALSGTTLRVSPVVADNYLCQFSQVLSGLSGSNATNWLLALAPDYYLLGCRAASYSMMEDEQRAAAYSSAALEILDELVSQGNVAEYGNAEMTFSQRMP